MMRWVLILAILLMLTGCAPLIVGTAAGLAIAHHENHRNWCIYHYGNPWCGGRAFR